jgi:hypothetical protein
VERSVSVAKTARGRHRDRWFFGGMAVAAALTVFAGFAPSYFLKGLYGAPAISPLVHLHGVLFTSWILLLLVQSTLIAVKRTDLHRRLGMAGGLLAVSMLVVGTAVAVAAAKRGPPPNALPGFPPPLEFLVIPLGDLTVFATLVAVGLYNRRKSDTHKRLMLLATIAILNAALSRLVFPGGALAFLGLPIGPLTFFGLTAVFVVACLLYDRITRSRVHPAFLWGGMFILVSQLLRVFIGGTDAWLAFAGWLTR